MSRYDPNSMTRVLNLEKFDFRERSSSCSSDSEQEESITGIFKTDIGVSATNAANATNKAEGEAGRAQRGGFFGIKRLGLSRKDREKDADAAAGSVKSDTDSRFRSSVETNSDETFMTLGTALTGDHVNALLKAHTDLDDDDIQDDEGTNEGVEDYWRATEPSTVLRDSNFRPSEAIIDDDVDEEVPISDRIADRGKSERRNTCNSLLTAPFDGHLDLSGHSEDALDVKDDLDVEDDLLKYVSAMVQNDPTPTSMGLGEGKNKRPVFVEPASAYSDVASTAETAKVGNTGVNSYDDDRRTSIEKIKGFFTGGGPAPAETTNSNETFDLRASCTVNFSASEKKNEEKNRKGWSRRTSDATNDSTWSWSQTAPTAATKTSGFNRRASSDSHNSANDSNDDDEKSHTSGGTFDNSWLGLGNIGQSNGRGGTSWRDTRRMTLTPFVDEDGHSFHYQRNTPYRLGERNLKRCIGILFVIAIVVLSGLLIGINITSKDRSGGEPMSKGFLSSSFAEEEMLAVEESVNQACSPLSVESPDGRHKCQQICHNHLCCFDNDEGGYNCKDDITKSCSIYSGCIALVGDLVNVGPAPSEVEHVDSETLASRIKGACTDIKTSIGKLECHKACDDHMCCFEQNSSKNCQDNEKMDCSVYEACSVLSADTTSDKGTVLDKPPLPSWDTAESVQSENAMPVIDYTDDENVVEEIVVTNGAGGHDGSSSSESEINIDQIFIPSPSDGGSGQFVSLGSSATSSKGVTEQEVVAACQNVSTANGRNKCAKMCMDYICCFESNEDKACLTNDDCAVYGSCVNLGSNTAFDSNLVVYDYESISVDDQYSYDDDMFVVDTEENDAEAYDNNVFHLGNRTILELEWSARNNVTPEQVEDETITEAGAVITSVGDETSEDDDIYIVDTEEEGVDAYDAIVFDLGERLLRGFI